ncbi:MAG: hypothetical protein AB1625_16295 [Acidobacteriota bacterium]
MSEGGGGADAGSIKELGWRQGSIVPLDLVKDLLDFGELPATVNEADILIVVSHDCDVTSANLANEPSVELLLARLLSEGTPNGALTHGKNPRRLHFLVEIDGRPTAVEARADERFVIDRTRLLGCRPELGRVCSRQVRDEIVLWLVKRYSRTAFPDAFNARIRKAQRPIARALESNGQALREIFLTMSSWDELPEGEPYRVQLIATMTREDYEDPEGRERAHQALDKVEEKLHGCSGVEIVEALLVSEAEVSLDEFRQMERFDFDYLSAETDEP